MLRNSFFSVLFIFLLPAFGACGPVEYMGQVGIRTNREFVAAQEIQAEKHAPFEYWSAYHYMHRARRKAGFGDYQDAIRYGQKSEKMSLEAQKRIKAGQLADNPMENEEGETGQDRPKVILDTQNSGGQ